MSVELRGRQGGRPMGSTSPLQAIGEITVLSEFIPSGIRRSRIWTRRPGRIVIRSGRQIADRLRLYGRPEAAAVRGRDGWESRGQSRWRMLRPERGMRYGVRRKGKGASFIRW